jgi:LuxR family transcriptional regulator, maltose regulon positive regulatory protein
MPVPILATKLYIPPPRPKLVLRPRLIERLNEGLQRKLTLISAPVGYGKTTLLSEWIPQSERCVTWLSLDDGDNDPVRFWAYFIAALQMLDAEIGRNTLALMRTPLLPPVEAILTSLLNEIAAFPDNFALVLDDYHVMDAKPVDESPHLPARAPAAPDAPGHHYPGGSKSAPGPVTRRDQLTELRASRLAFYLLRSRRFSQPDDGSRTL